MKNFNVESLLQPGIRGLRAYDPGHDMVSLRKRFGTSALLELGANENPYGPSSSVLPAVLSSLESLHRYPDPRGAALKQALATLHRVDVGQILLGNGSHELLMQFSQAFAGPDTDIVAAKFGFAVYTLACQAVGANLRLANAYPPGHAMPRGHDLDEIARSVTATTRLVYLANPNNPTGTWFERDGLERVLQGLPPTTLVVVDEAYAEYVTTEASLSAVPLLAHYPNLIVTRTFSKCYGIAALRVGYALADRAVVSVMERLRESFNVNSLGLAAATVAVADQAHVASIRERNAVERTILAEELRQRGYPVHPSQTNFLLVEFGSRAAAIEHALCERGVVLRSVAGYDLPECLRITVGTSEQNSRLIGILDDVTERPNLASV